MAENSKIEWTDHTFNPWIGCTQVGPGCDHCYAAAQDEFRHWTPEGWGGPRRRTSDANWAMVHRWDRVARQTGKRARVFCASLADVFDNEVPPEWRADLFGLIHATPHLDWLLLTKRIGNAHTMIGEALILLAAAERAEPTALLPSWPWPNVWIGATVVDQEEAHRDIPKLLATPARVRFLSMEPLLAAVDLLSVLRRHAGLWNLHWVIVGGESGHGARPMHPDWARSLRDQCAAAGVPFLFKQWGEWCPWGQLVANTPNIMARGKVHTFPDGAEVERFGKARAGRLLEGFTHDGFPSPP